MNQDEEIAVSLSMIEMIKLLGLMVWRKCHGKAVTTIQPTNRCYWECVTLRVDGRMDQDENVFFWQSLICCSLQLAGAFGSLETNISRHSLRFPSCSDGCNYF